MLCRAQSVVATAPSGRRRVPIPPQPPTGRGWPFRDWQIAVTQGGNGDAVFEAQDEFADNPGQIFSTVTTVRQIQLTARFAF